MQVDRDFPHSPFHRGYMYPFVVLALQWSQFQFPSSGGQGFVFCPHLDLKTVFAAQSKMKCVPGLRTCRNGQQCAVSIISQRGISRLLCYCSFFPFLFRYVLDYGNTSPAPGQPHIPHRKTALTLSSFLILRSWGWSFLPFYTAICVEGCLLSVKQHSWVFCSRRVFRCCCITDRSTFQFFITFQNHFNVELISSQRSLSSRLKSKTKSQRSKFCSKKWRITKSRCSGGWGLASCQWPPLGCLFSRRLGPEFA